MNRTTLLAPARPRTPHPPGGPAAPSSRKAGGYGLFLLPAVLVTLVLAALPLAGLAVMSLLRWNPTAQAGPAFAGLGNYRQMLGDHAFWGSLGSTVLFVVETVILQLALGIAVAVLFNRSGRGIGVLRALLLTPMMVAPVFAGMVWRLLLDPNYGPVKYFLSLIHVPAPLWLADPHVALQSIVIANTWQWTPFVVLFTTAGLQVIPKELYEAGSLDGAGRLRQFWHLTLPLLRPVLLVITLFRVIDAFKVFDVVYTMTGGGPGTSTQMLSYSVYDQTVRFLNLGYSSTLALVLLGVVVLASWMLTQANRKAAGA